MDSRRWEGFLWIVRAVMAVIVASNPTLVSAITNYNQSSSNITAGNIFKDGAPTPSPMGNGSATTNSRKFGSWVLHCAMPEPINVHCYSQMADLGDRTLNPQQTMSHEFPIDEQMHTKEVWNCHFDWVAESIMMHAVQTFEVWAHDGSQTFLDKCTHCVWKVGRDGFSYQLEFNGLYYHQWDWQPASLPS